MELQDRSRLYPTLSQPQGALVMGSDGRLQYAPLSGVPVGLAPSAPPAPSSSSAPQQHYQQLPIASAPPTSLDALQAQRSLDCWAKWVRIVSIILFALTGTFAIIWATELLYPTTYEPKKHCPFGIALKLVVFILLLVTFKFGVKAGTLKTSVAAKRFLKMLVFMGIFGLVMGGFKAYWRMKRRHGHRKHQDDKIPEDDREPGEEDDSDHPENIRPPTRLLKETDENEDDPDDADDKDDADDNDESKHRNHGCGPNGHNGHNGHNSDWDDNKGDKDDEDEDDKDDKDDEDDRDDRDDFERSKHRGYRGRKHCHVGCVILLAVYAIVVFMAYKLYRAARNFEQHAQRGNIPVVPVMVQQPVQAYAPGLYPGNIPVGAPVQH